MSLQNLISTNLETEGEDNFGTNTDLFKNQMNPNADLFIYF